MRFALQRGPAPAPEDGARLPARRSARPSACARSGRRESGRSPELWKKLADVGLPGLLVPEAHGGMGLDEIDVVLLLEECGRAALAEPVVATAAVGAPLLAELGDAALAARWLPRVAAGEAIARRRPSRRTPSSPTRTSPTCCCSPDAGGELHAVPRAAARLIAQPANDPSQRLFARRASTRGAATLRRRAASAARALLAAALDRGALACAAQLVGVAEQLLELAVGYASQRQQFGRPIGSFQAVKHHARRRQGALEYARPLVYRAAWSVARGDRAPRAPRLDGEGRGGRGGGPRRAQRAPGARRDRLHLGAGSAPLDAARLVARPRLGHARVPPRRASPARDRCAAGRRARARAPPSAGAERHGRGIHRRRGADPGRQARRRALAGPPGRPRRARAEGADGAHRRRSRAPSRT